MYDAGALFFILLTQTFIIVPTTAPHTHLWTEPMSPVWSLTNYHFLKYIMLVY